MTSVVNIVSFVGEVISCSSNNIPQDLAELQRQRHTHSCHPKPGKLSRFEIPFFSMDKTEVLFELEATDPRAKISKQLATSFRESLDNIPPQAESFEASSKFVGITREQHILTIRSVLNRPKLLLK